MSRILTRGAVAVALLAAMIATTIAADKNDKKKPAVTSAPSGEYTALGEVTGILAKAPDGKSNSITFRINQFALQKGNAGLNLKNPMPAKGGDNKDRPAANPIPGIKEIHHDFDLELTADVKIRNVKLPPKTDDKGAKIPYTAAELQKLKGGTTLRGYVADPGDLKAGQIVTLNLVKIKGSQGEMANKSFVNRVFIEGEGTPIEEPKKKKDK